MPPPSKDLSNIIVYKDYQSDNYVLHLQISERVENVCFTNSLKTSTLHKTYILHLLKIIQVENTVEVSIPKK
jgi:hypothetical protein